MRDQITLLIKTLIITLLFISVNATSYAQNVYSTGIYLGDYSLNFNGNREAQLTVYLPKEFQNNCISGGGGSGYGFTGFSIPPLRVDRFTFLGSELILTINKHTWDGEERIQLLISTNKKNNWPGSDVFLYANVDIMGIKE